MHFLQTFIINTNLPFCMQICMKVTPNKQKPGHFTFHINGSFISTHLILKTDCLFSIHYSFVKCSRSQVRNGSQCHAKLYSLSSIKWFSSFSSFLRNDSLDKSCCFYCVIVVFFVVIAFVIFFLSLEQTVWHIFRYISCATVFVYFLSVTMTVYAMVVLGHISKYICRIVLTNIAYR